MCGDSHGAENLEVVIVKLETELFKKPGAAS